jgi:hypothetical protein
MSEAFPEETSEAFGESFDREKEGRLGVDPVGGVGREPASGDDAVKVRMMGKVLSPGVKDGNKARGGAEMRGILGEFEKGTRSSVKEEIVEKTRMSEEERVEEMGEGEDDVEMGNGENAMERALNP